MATTQIITHTILDTEVETIIKVDLVGGTFGGGGDDLIDDPIYDPASYYNKGINKKLIKLQYVLDGFSGVIKWDDIPSSGTNTLLVLQKDEYSEFNFEPGISNNDIADKNGIIIMSTFGIDTNRNGTLIMHLVNQNYINGKP